MTFGSAVVQLLSGLTSAGILFLVAAGMTLVFGAMRIINVAHGSFYMFGAYLLATPLTFFFTGEVGFWPRMIAAPLVVLIMGAVVEISVLRQIYDREHLAQLLATFALFYIFADIAQMIWGGQYRTVPAPIVLAGQTHFGSYAFPTYSLFVIAVAAVVGLLLFALLRLTMFGWRVRAAQEDPELLASTGSNVRILSTALFSLGALLAGLAGAVVAPLQAVTSGMDASIIVAALIVSMVGGLGSISGAALGAIVIGVFQSFGVIWLPHWSSTFIYVVMILLLAFRPAGIMGRQE